jgi:hypothetical protein
MLTNPEALDVVIRCVNGVSSRVVTPTQTLKDGGIVDAPRLQAFKSLVVSDPSRGVPNHQHRIDSSDLSGVSIDDSAQATADVVRANATPMGAGVLLGGPAEAPVERAATRRASRKRAARKKAAKTARTTRSAKKAGKKKATRKRTSKRSKRARKSRAR